MRTLYFCYFGLREPLVQTQVLPYLRELVAGGIAVSLLTFEPEMRKRWTREAIAAMRAQLAREGIAWRALPYHKRPSLLATLYDICRGAATAVRLTRRDGIEVFHARAHMPLAMVLLAQLVTPRKFVFDIRGLIADEYVDAGIWKNASAVYRVIKWLERAGIRRADQIIVLTERMKQWLERNHAVSAARIEVIPCCTDFSRFAAADAEPAERADLVYAGSVTGLYLLEEMGRFFRAWQVHRPGAVLRILTASPVEPARAQLRRAGLQDRDFWIGNAAPSDVPGHLARATAGLSFRKATFSQIAASPTKIPEYLAAGLPVVSNAGIGDTDAVLTADRVGVVVEELTETAYTMAAEQLARLLAEPALAERCRQSARRRFDLSGVGGPRYRRVYERLREGVTNHVQCVQ
jgi:glycosyltransferase involved in cell wall biosynthesis